MKDPSRANDGERHVPTAASEDGGALGEAAMAVATGSRHSPPPPVRVAPMLHDIGLIERTPPVRVQDARARAVVPRASRFGAGSL
jgi:hypothetical protein